MQFNTWDERTQFLSDFQDAITSVFGLNDYNVFIFGSFLTNSYVPESSDLDLAVYSADFRLTRRIVYFITDYLEQRDIPHDIIIIDISQHKAFVAMEPLRLNIGCTDYFPDELRTYYARLIREFIYYNEEKKFIQEKFPVHY